MKALEVQKTKIVQEQIEKLVNLKVLKKEATVQCVASLFF